MICEAAQPAAQLILRSHTAHVFIPEFISHVAVLQLSATFHFPIVYFLLFIFSSFHTRLHEAEFQLFGSLYHSSFSNLFLFLFFLFTLLFLAHAVVHLSYIVDGVVDVVASINVPSIILWANCPNFWHLPRCQRDETDELPL